MSSCSSDTLPEFDLDATCRAIRPWLISVLRHGTSLRCADGERRRVRLINEADVEDVCQQVIAVFIAHCRDGRFDVTRSARPYVRRIAFYAAIRCVQRQKRWAQMPAVVENLPATVPHPADAVCLAARLASLRSELETEDRALLEICLDDDHSQSSAGRLLGLSRDQV